MITGGALGIPDILFIVALLVCALWKKGWLRIILSLSIIIWGTFAMQYDIKIAASLLAVASVLFIQVILVQIQHAREET